MTTILMLFSLFETLAYQIVWNQTWVEIPLYENVENYRYYPYAKLMQDQKEIIDPFMYYETNGVERTFFHTINSSVVKTYTIKYRVHFPSYNQTHTQSITFSVVDKIPPVIKEVPEYQLPLGSKLPDLKTGVIYDDNYDPVSSLTLSIDISSVVLNKVGKYEIIYRVTDLSLNTSQKVGYLWVYDHIPPEVTLKKQVIIPFGTSLDIYTFFTIKDNYDSHLDIILDDSNVFYHQLGTYMFSLKVTDKSGNYTFITESITIIDIKPPILVLTSKPKPIMVYEQVTDDMLLENVILFYDDVDELSVRDIIMEHLIESDVVGIYDVYYRVSDKSNNITTIKIKVSVVDIEKPKIELLKELVFDVYSPLPFFEDLIDFHDNYSKKENLILKITHSVKMNIIGYYPISISVTDQSLNKETLNLYVEIKDQIPPEIEQHSEMIITDFMKKDFRLYFDVKDQYDAAKDIKITIMDEGVIYDQVGFYPCLVMACDKSLNCATLETQILVFDIIDPVLVLSKTKVYLEVNDIIPDLSSYIVSVSDNYDTLSKLDVLIQGDIHIDQVGKYIVTYKVRDQSGNTVIASIDFYVDDYIRPELDLTDLNVMQYETIDLKKDIHLGDDEELYIFPNHIDTSKVGSVIVTYILYDSRGNYSSYDRVIHIMNVKEDLNIKSFLPLLGVLASGISTALYLYVKSKRHFL